MVEADQRSGRLLCRVWDQGIVVHLSHGQNPYKATILGVVWDPYDKATRLYTHIIYLYIDVYIVYSICV